MGIIICPKHGRSGISSTCAHVQQSVLNNERNGINPIRVDLYLDADSKDEPELYYYLCSQCAETIQERFGELAIRGDEKWSECEDIADPKSAVCWKCLTDLFLELRK